MIHINLQLWMSESSSKEIIALAFSCYESAMVRLSSTSAWKKICSAGSPILVNSICSKESFQPVTSFKPRRVKGLLSLVAAWDMQWTLVVRLSLKIKKETRFSFQR
jgi:hypothetical protein